jgi:branched-chain amino acid transport system ATP-binding protein
VVVVGRALMSRPKLIMLDEPSLGLAPLVVKNIFEILHRIYLEQGPTLWLVEQNANLALQ